MEVRNFEPDFYEVHWREAKRRDPRRWGTAAKTADGWYLMNETSRLIKPDGALGKKMIAAVEKFIATKG